MLTVFYWLMLSLESGFQRFGLILGTNSWLGLGTNIISFMLKADHKVFGLRHWYCWCKRLGYSLLMSESCVERMIQWWWNCKQLKRKGCAENAKWKDPLAMSLQTIKSKNSLGALRSSKVIKSNGKFEFELD